MRTRYALALTVLALIVGWLLPPTLRPAWVNPPQVCTGMDDETPSPKATTPDHKRRTTPAIPRLGWQRRNPTA